MYSLFAAYVTLECNLTLGFLPVSVATLIDEREKWFCNLVTDAR